MRQIISVDIQKTYDKWCRHLLDTLIEYINNDDDIVFIVDLQGLSDDVEEEFYDYIIDYILNHHGMDDDELNDFNYKLRQYPIITKEYGGLRSLMDTGFDDEDIIEFGKICFDNSNKIYKLGKRELIELLKEHNIDEDMIDYIIKYDSFVSDVFNGDNISVIKKNITLIGGALDQCLKEVYLTLKILGNYDIEIDHNNVY